MICSNFLHKNRIIVTYGIFSLQLPCRFLHSYTVQIKGRSQSFGFMMGAFSVRLFHTMITISYHLFLTEHLLAFNLQLTRTKSGGENHDLCAQTATYYCGLNTINVHSPMLSYIQSLTVPQPLGQVRNTCSDNSPLLRMIRSVWSDY